MIARCGLFLLFVVAQVARAESLPQSVEVFVLSDQARHIEAADVLASSGVQVWIHRLDAVDRWEREKSQSLPTTEDEKAAVSAAKAMAQTFNESEKQTLIAGWHALRRADALAVSDVPAIVIDQRSVIFGLYDLGVAVRVWQEQRQ